MKKSYRIIALMIVLSMFVAGAGIQKRSVAKSKYWISAGSTMAGGKGNLIYLGKKLKIKGKWGKGSTLDAASDKAWSSGKSFNKTLKFGKNVKVVEMEDPMKVYSLDLYVSTYNIKKGKKMQFIQGYVYIVNNKVKKICFSA